MFCARTKTGVAQTTAWEFQEETRNGEATVRIVEKKDIPEGL
jgi:hypothetical protein